MAHDFSPGPDGAAQLDRLDPLAPYRQRFYYPADTIYLDGNSLGLASRDAEAALQQVFADWQQLGVEGWTEGERAWFFLAENLGKLQAAVVGADPAEVVVTGSTTVNLHTLAAGFYQPVPGRSKVVAQELEFPSDIYALRSQIALRGLDPAAELRLVRSRDGRTIAAADVIAAMTDDVALVILPIVLYRSGQLLDVAGLTAAAHARGIAIGWDGCHAAGSVPLRLAEWDVDFAFWCNYKYLNAGPGAPGSLYVNRRHFGRRPGLAGWFGSDKQRQFDMALDFTPAAAAGAWQIGTPTILGSAALLGSLRPFAEVGMERLRAKSVLQTEYLIYLADTYLGDLGFHVGTPRAAAERGGHVALEHADAALITRALRARGVVPDFRQPNIVRLAPVPLYNSFAEIWRAVSIIREIVERGEHRQYAGVRDVVS